MKSNGQLGNRLLISSHALSHALANGEAFIDLTFFRYIEYFEVSQECSERKIVIVSSFGLSKIITSLLIWTNSIFQFLSSTRFLDAYSVGWVHTELKDLSRKNKILLLEGEGFRDTENLFIQKDIIKKVFTLKEKYQKKIRTQLEKYRHNDSLLVGVHIRRGDYKYWMDGKYYFQDNVYEEAIRQFTYLQVHPEITYLLFSDEPVIKANYKGDKIFISTNPMIVDLYLLSECDYIIGPPSTFSGWASFYGMYRYFISHQWSLK